MANVRIEGIPEELLEKLMASARENRRSLSSELLARLETSWNEPWVDAEALIARVERLQQRANLPPLTDELLERAIAEGRP